MEQYLRENLPLNILDSVAITNKTGLIVVDAVDGFCKVGAGNLAPPTDEAAEYSGVKKMVKNIEAIANDFYNHEEPILLFLDNHDSERPEEPYPPHCVEGSGEEELIVELQFLYEEHREIIKNGQFESATQNISRPVHILKKDCINGFVGGIDNNDGSNTIINWINKYNLEQVVVVGICTSICVMQFVQTLLSVRNHNSVPTLKDVIVYTDAVADYNLPKDVATTIGLPEFAAHPQEVVEYMGLYFMMSSGAILAKNIDTSEITKPHNPKSQKITLSDL